MNKKIVVVGGVAGGASFAARMRRLDEHAEIIMFEKGDYISFANCGLPYHIGKTIQKREALILQTPQSFKKRFNVDVRILSEVISVNPEKGIITVKRGNSIYDEQYDYLVLSPGCIPVRPKIPGIDNKKIFTLRNIIDMDKINSYIEKKSINNAVIIGGGFIGLEMVENIKLRDINVTLVELADQVLPPLDKEMASMLNSSIIKQGVTLYLKTGAKEFLDLNDQEIKVILSDNNQIATELVILAIGVRADTEFLKDSGLKQNERGFLVVDKFMRTNFDNIFAVGDAVEVYEFISNQKVQIPLAGPANRQGRIAADNIAGNHTEYKNTQGTAICKIFNMVAAVTGLSEKNAKRWNIPYIKSYTHSANHAEYYPGTYPVSIKTIFDSTSGKILGAQIIGKNGVDKRIDIFAAAIRNKLSVSDLTELELAYAPPFGSAKDPVNIAGFVAQNIINKRMNIYYPEEIEKINYKKQILLDVRTKMEHKANSIENSLHIPVDELRNRLNELDVQKDIVVYCQIGYRGYVAARILVQNGFKVRNLSGGFFTYLAYMNKL